jgi:hypothetical protein
MSEYNNFIFYKEWLEQLAIVAIGGDANDMVSLLDGLADFLEGKEPEDLTPMARLVYNQMAAQIARDKEHLKETTSSRSENGKKGANARWNKANDGKGMANDSKPMANDDKEWQTIANDSHKEEVEEEVEVEEHSVLVSCAGPLIGLPLNDGTEHPVTESDLTEYSSLYPAVNVMQELRNMRGWLLSNPTKRKTKRGIKAFITTWLQKEQDKPKARSGTNTRRMSAEEILAIPAINPWTEAAQ